MPDECIHGLEAGLCDVCYPKPVPVAVVPAKTAAPRSRATTSSRATAAGKADHKVGEQRIYHVTHVNNLAGIVEAGGLVAPATPIVDASSAETRETRRETSLGVGVVADYVPFFLSPNAAVWESIRLQRADPRLSREVRDLPPAEFVILVSTVTAAANLEVAIADGDAANTFTRFATTPETNDRMLRGLRADERTILTGEFLVHEAFPFDRVALVGVANDRARDQVKELLQAAAHEPKIAVYPPWFARD